MPSVDETKKLLESYQDLFQRRKASIATGERIRLTQELNELEQQIRQAVKTHPVPEPVGQEKLQRIADQMHAMGFSFLAIRLTGQHYRNPIAVPFRNLDHVRDYIGGHLDDENLSKIEELKPKKKLFGLF